MWSHLSHVEWPWLRFLAFVVIIPVLWFVLLLRLAVDAPIVARVIERRRARHLRRAG